MSEPRTPFNDPRAQQVYQILCDTDGWTARRIVDALFPENEKTQSAPRKETLK